MFRRPAKVRAGEPVSAAHFNAIIDALPGGLALGQGLIGGVDGQGVISLALAGQLALMAAPARITAVHSPSPDDAPVDEVTYDAALIKESSAKVVNAAPVIGRLIAEEMSLGDMTILLKLRKGQYSLVEEKVAPGSAAAGRAIRDLAFRRNAC